MKIALYIRLSKSDGDKTESDSVKSQRNMLNDFVSGHPDLAGGEIFIFIDDDYTGTNFNRPGLQDMLGKAKNGELDCIIVKDFSRFARSSVETSEYLELIFPFLNIRFISVTNNYDSDFHKGATAGLEASVPALIAEMYSRDLSVKVKTALETKRKKGEFISSRARFGYVRSKTVKNKVEIDPVAAGVVRRIFSMAAEGIKPIEIARILNSEGVDSPMAHYMKQNPGKNCYHAKSNQLLWRYENVKRIIHDEIYTGKFISGRIKKCDFGSSRMKAMPKESWVVYDDMVPAIISEEIFSQAQNVIKKVKEKTGKQVQSIFARKLDCGHCGYTLKRHSNGSYVCITNRYNDNEKCFDGHIKEEWLKEQVLTAYVNVIGEHNLVINQEQRQGMDIDDLKIELRKLRVSAQRLKDAKKDLFEGFTFGDIDEVTFKDDNFKLTKQLNEMNQAITDLDMELGKAGKSFKKQSILEVAGAKTTAFSEDMMRCVKSIQVFDTGNAVVYIDFTEKR